VRVSKLRSDINRSDDAIRTIAIGGLLSLLAFLVVPVFILAGYFIRVLNRTAGGDEVPPVFDEWGELAVTGLQAVLIGVAYALVPTILGGGVVAIGIGSAATAHWMASAWRLSWWVGCSGRSFRSLLPTCFRQHWSTSLERGRSVLASRSGR